MSVSDAKPSAYEVLSFIAESGIGDRILIRSKKTCTSFPGEGAILLIRFPH